VIIVFVVGVASDMRALIDNEDPFSISRKALSRYTARKTCPDNQIVKHDACSPILVVTALLIVPYHPHSVPELPARNASVFGRRLLLSKRHTGPHGKRFVVQQGNVQDNQHAVTDTMPRTGQAVPVGDFDAGGDDRSGRC
jgi:hypothetical protein